MKKYFCSNRICYGSFIPTSNTKHMTQRGKNYYCQGCNAVMKLKSPWEKAILQRAMGKNA